MECCIILEKNIKSAINSKQIDVKHISFNRKNVKSKK